MSNERRSRREVVADVRGRVETTRDKAQRTLLGQVWYRMLEIEFVDRSVALAGKAFVSFFPLVIVVAAFMPPHIRESIYSTLTRRLGIRGNALASAKRAFATSNDVRKATGLLGLVMTFFFASSFTTAVQRVYLRVWRRPPGVKVGAYTRGLAWLAMVLLYMALIGGIRNLLDNFVGAGVAIPFFVVLSIASSFAYWWFTAWYLLLGDVRWRVLAPTGLITAIAMLGYALSAAIWMPNVVTRNESQFGFFGVALALVTWFSGAATCILVSACAGAVAAEDDGVIGRFVRGSNPLLLAEAALPALPAPTGQLSVRDAFKRDDEV
jgi:membrane protein